MLAQCMSRMGTRMKAMVMVKIDLDHFEQCEVPFLEKRRSCGAWTIGTDEEVTNKKRKEKQV